jgi:sarcosine/dimethylglycine N-methyltransferase
VSGEAGTGTVVHYYETHPINEHQILAKLEADGIALDGLSEEVLQHYDQDHFGGLAAVETLAARARIGPGMHVLDVCSGVGGPARFLAHHYGCRVSGLDLTESRHRAALRLTRMVGLDHLVDFHHGDAQDMPFADATFDVVIGQEAFAHVPDKARLIGECARVAKPGGRIAFTDIVRRESLPQDALERLRREMTFLTLESLEGYGRLLHAAGCTVEECEDLGDPWTGILEQRLEMYRSLRPTTIAKFGEEHFRRWDAAYSFFVGLYRSGELTGGRFVAVRNA